MYLRLVLTPDPPSPTHTLTCIRHWICLSSGCLRSWMVLAMLRSGRLSGCEACSMAAAQSCRCERCAEACDS